MFLYFAGIVLGLYLLALAAIYFMQEKLLFQPEVLSRDYKFSFYDAFNEVFIPVEKGVQLHGLLFKAEHPKGLVFYLHGNGGVGKRVGQ